jgi:hypothetical protein
MKAPAYDRSTPRASPGFHQGKHAGIHTRAFAADWLLTKIEN